MVVSLEIHVPGKVYAKRLLEEIGECCNNNVNTIPCNDYYALRLLVRELSVDRIPNDDEYILNYFVFSREIDGDYKKLIKGQKELLEDLVEYRNKKRNKPMKTLDSFIRAIGG